MNKGPYNLDDFSGEAKNLVKDYFHLQQERIKLIFIRYLAKATAGILEAMISFLLAFLFIGFAGITLGFWLSRFTGSLAAGFGIVSLLILFLILALHLLRHQLFINPAIRKLLRRLTEHYSSQQPPNETAKHDN